MSLAQRMHFLQDVLQMTAIAFVSVIKNYHINELHLFWDILYTHAHTHIYIYIYIYIYNFEGARGLMVIMVEIEDHDLSPKLGQDYLHFR